MASQNTLTAPADRDKEHLFDFNKNPLNAKQVENAKEALVDKAVNVLHEEFELEK